MRVCVGGRGDVLLVHKTATICAYRRTSRAERMAKIIILLFLFVAKSAVGTGQSCDPAELPEECRPILFDTIDFAANFNQSHFIITYCGTSCLRPLYGYFSNCDDPDSNNATLLDFYCGSNEDGDRCVLTAIIDPDSFVFECINPFSFDGDSSCAGTCQNALTTAYDCLGCCVFSYYAVRQGLLIANTIFGLCSEDPRALCVGGATGQTLQLPAPYNPECEEFVEDVDESCRYLLAEDITSIAFVNPEAVCGDECGPQVYQFFQNCDETTGTYNTTITDIFCAINSKGKRCGSLFLNITHIWEACRHDIFNNTCTADCKTTLRVALPVFGCCLPTITQSFVNGAGIILSALCGLEHFRNCIGHFSGEPVPPPVVEPTVGPTTSNRCHGLRSAIPDACQELSTVESIAYSALSDDDFVNKFCKSNCAKPVYDYIVECGNRTDGTYVDFLCSQSSTGTECRTIFRNEALDAVEEGVCKDASDKQCSRQCSVALGGFNKQYSCCFFTYWALETNVSYANALWARCQVQGNPRLCTGGISKSTIDAPGGGSKHDTSAATVTFSSALILIISFAFGFSL